MLTAFLTAFLLALGLRKIAPFIGLIDHSGLDVRKPHQGRPALVGGAAIVITILGISLFRHSMTLPDSLQPVLTGMALLALLGVMDDARHVPALRKLALQTAIVFGVFVFYNFKLTTLGQLFGYSSLNLPDYIAFVFTGLCTLAFINAFNLVDGLDGLSGGIAAVNLLLFGGIAGAAGFIEIHSLALLLFAAVCGFLVLNMRSPLRSKALVFLGDGGSLSLSFGLACFALYLGNAYTTNPALPAPVVYAFLLAYPLYDMLIVMWNRYRNGHSIVAPDTAHMHFLLKRLHLSDKAIAPLLILVSAVYALIGLLGWRYGLSQSVLAGLWIVLLVGHFFFYKLVLHRIEQMTKNS
jgi:UDP-GlcNAc:undecaprenyl-phosphate GlcNAc-1-phosphate transferase